MCALIVIESAVASSGQVYAYDGETAFFDATSEDNEIVVVEDSAENLEDEIVIVEEGDSSTDSAISEADDIESNAQEPSNASSDNAASEINSTDETSVIVTTGEHAGSDEVFEDELNAEMAGFCIIDLIAKLCTQKFSIAGRNYM